MPWQASPNPLAANNWTFKTDMLPSVNPMSYVMTNPVVTTGLFVKVDVSGANKVIGASDPASDITQKVIGFVSQLPPPGDTNVSVIGMVPGITGWAFAAYAAAEGDLLVVSALFTPGDATTPQLLRLYDSGTDSDTGPIAKALSATTGIGQAFRIVLI